VLGGRLKRPEVEATPPSPLMAFPADNISPHFPVKIEILTTIAATLRVSLGKSKKMEAPSSQLGQRGDT